MKYTALAIGLTYSVFLLLFGFMLAGAGHGWGGALFPGFCAMFTTSAIAVAYVKPQYERFHLLAKTLLILFMLDLILCMAVCSEYSAFLRVKAQAVLWIALFIAPQLLALVRFLRDKSQLKISVRDLSSWCAATLRRLWTDY